MASCEESSPIVADWPSSFLAAAVLTDSSSVSNAALRFSSDASAAFLSALVFARDFLCEV